jgi:hypothetical protein
MFDSKPAVGLALLLAVAAAHPQYVTPMPSAPAANASAADASAANASAANAPFRSALDGYRPFADQEVAPWKQTNDTVREVGGWRAYAREVQEAAAAASAASAAGHGGHHPERR